MPAATRRLHVSPDQRPFRPSLLRHRERHVVGRANLRIPADVLAKVAQTRPQTPERLLHIVWRVPRQRVGDQTGSISTLRSAAGAECVSAPTDTKSAPVIASSGSRARVTPPEISVFARPR